MLAAVLSVIFLGASQARKAASLFTKPVTTSRLPANIALTAITATDCGGTWNLCAAFFALSFNSARLGKSVSVGPGLIQVTDTEVFFSSCDNPRLKLSTNTFEAAYKLK